MKRSIQHLDVTSMTRRAFMAALMAILLVLGGARAGSAEIEWCRVDPVVTINGVTYNIILSSPVSIMDSATGPSEVVIGVPDGTSASLVSTDAGFGYGETVSFTEVRGKRTPAGFFRVDVWVPASDSLPVLVEVIGPAGTRSAEGETNGWITVVVTG